MLVDAKVAEEAFSCTDARTLLDSIDEKADPPDAEEEIFVEPSWMVSPLRKRSRKRFVSDPRSYVISSLGMILPETLTDVNWALPTTSRALLGVVTPIPTLDPVSRYTLESWLTCQLASKTRPAFSAMLAPGRGKSGTSEGPLTSPRPRIAIRLVALAESSYLYNSRLELSEMRKPYPTLLSPKLRIMLSEAPSTLPPTMRSLLTISEPCTLRLLRMSSSLRLV